MPVGRVRRAVRVLVRGHTLAMPVFRLNAQATRQTHRAPTKEIAISAPVYARVTQGTTATQMGQ